MTQSAAWTRRLWHILYWLLLLYVITVGFVSVVPQVFGFAPAPGPTLHADQALRQCHARCVAAAGRER